MEVIADKERELEALRELVREFESALSDARRSGNGHSSGSEESLRMLNDQVRVHRQEVADRTRTIVSLKVQLEACHNAMARHNQTMALVRQELNDAREENVRLSSQVQSLQGTIDFLHHRKDVDRYGGLTPEQVGEERLAAQESIRTLALERDALADQVKALRVRVGELECASRQAADLAATLSARRAPEDKTAHRPWRRVFRDAPAEAALKQNGAKVE